ncbi:CBS domain-containing protein [Urechidicola croceus]|uniref:Acetoin utilization protein acuB n=1 Tax=Urechidicola croceus TaxID=1850246 RepID=A0A1D8P7T7_9FLAO|nr:CBS domain-containing protein [Urechidicola croceus]AOW20638.1 acetoin utilization protein acuB [Urechidicola croceus]
MKIADYISKDVKALTLNSKIGKAKQLFDTLTFSHLPIVENKKLIGLIMESDVRTVYDDNLRLIDYKDLLNEFHAKVNDNWMDILKKFSSNETNILPVLTDDNIYIGYYELTDVLHYFNDTPLLNHEGFFIVLEKNSTDYSFSQVAQIVESNDAKLIGIFVSGFKNDMVRITLKISSEEINEIIQSFRRYGYNLLTKHKEDLYLEELKDRSNYLQKYLNI